jgi:4-amino-4-deoxy-L-arabinose transferase-like glycosyltransferase
MSSPEAAEPERPSRLSGWRGYMLAALVALIAGLPGVFAMPPLDRDESRFAQATAQMLETGDFVNIEFQEEPRHKKPVGIHWLQAASVGVLSSAEAREIWAYRIPSLLAAALAAAACAWGAAAFFGARAAFAAGAILGMSFILSSEAFIAKTDAALCASVTLMMAALGRLYGEYAGGAPAGRPARTLLWCGFAASVLIKGPIGPMVLATTLLGLFVLERRIRWARKIGWVWGLVLTLLVVGPWAVAITVQTDGGFWGEAIGGDLAPKLAGGHERHGGPPGYHLLATPLLFFPATLLLPAAAVVAWTRRAEPGVRFALAWLIPAFLVFELSPTKLVHYTLPMYGALAWLAAASLQQPIGRAGRWGGAALALLAGAAIAAVAIYGTAEFGSPGDSWAAGLTAVLAVSAALAGAVLLVRRQAARGLAVAGVLGVLAHGAMAAVLIPRLEPLLVSTRVADALAADDLHPREGLAPGPVEVAGYAEPSLVFLLGTGTGLGDAPEAAAAVAQGRPAVVERSLLPAFQRELAARGVRGRQVAVVEGFNYSGGDPVALHLFRRESAP